MWIIFPRIDHYFSCFDICSRCTVTEDRNEVCALDIIPKHVPLVLNKAVVDIVFFADRIKKCTLFQPLFTFRASLSDKSLNFMVVACTDLNISVQEYDLREFPKMGVSAVSLRQEWVPVESND